MVAFGVAIIPVVRRLLVAADKVFDEIYLRAPAKSIYKTCGLREHASAADQAAGDVFDHALRRHAPRARLGGWHGLNAIIGHMPDGDNLYGWRFVDIIFSSSS